VVTFRRVKSSLQFYNGPVAETMIKRAFSKNVMGRTQTVVFHDSNVGNSVEDGENSYHSQDSLNRKKCRESLQCHQQRLARQHSLTGYISSMEHASEV